MALQHGGVKRPADSALGGNLAANGTQSRNNCDALSCTPRTNALYDDKMMAHSDTPQTGDAAAGERHAADQATLLGTLVHLWPYIWPGDRADLKMRVVWSVVLLLIAKVATLAVPFTFKWATDALP